MPSAWRYLCRICRHAHRGSGTPQEAAAAHEIGEWLTDLGYEVNVQPFRTPRDTLYLGPAVVLAGYLVILVATWNTPVAGLLLAAALLFPLVGELLGSDRLNLDVILPRYPSQNVIAHQPEPPGEGHRRTLVLSAHLDTQRGAYLFHPRFAPWLQAYFYVVYGLLLAALGCMGLRWTAPDMAGLGLARWVSVALLAINVLFLAACRWRGRYINGANDNGSGVAVLLALAKRFRAEPLPHTRVIFVATGAEEVGTRGMKRFCRAFSFDPATAAFVNIDNVGSGRLHYLTGEGMLRVYPYSRPLIEFAQAAAQVSGLPVVPRSNLLLPTDGLVPVRAGYQSISFLAFDDQGRLPNYHWHTDVIDRVDRSFLEAVERFLEVFCRQIDRHAVQRSHVDRP